MKNLVWYFMALLGGCLYALGAPSWPIFWHPVLAVSGVGIFLASLSLFGQTPQEHPLRHDLFSWFLFSLGLYLTGFNWIPGTMQNFGGLPPILSYFLGLLSAFILMPQILIFILLMHGGKKWGWPKDLERISNKSFYLLLLTILWLLLENFIPQQFPYHVGHSFMRFAPYLAPATIGGEPLYSAAAMWVAFAVALFIRQKYLDYWAVGTFGVLLITSFLIPLSNPYQDAAQGKPLNLRIVQGSIGNDLKTRAERGDLQAIQEVNRIYYELSTAPAAEKLDLIIWPETAIYQPFNSNLLAAQPPINWPFIVDRTLLQTKTDLFTGGYDIYDLQQFNSAFYFTQPAAPQEGQPDTEQRTAHPINFAGRYHKMQLLAFGETLPFGIFNDLIYPYLGNLVSNFTPGKDYAVFTTANNITFVPNICYEILLSAWQRNYLQHLTLSPDLMINLTNDSWFGVTAEPEQHLFLGQWRAVEFQKAIVRSTNSGITTIIYPNGKTSERLEVNVRANLDQTIYIHPTAPTIYQRFGLGVVLALAGLLLIFIKIFSLPQKSNWQIKAKFKFKF